MDLRWEYSPTEVDEPGSREGSCSGGWGRRLGFLALGLALSVVLVGLSARLPFWRPGPSRHQEDVPKRSWATGPSEVSPGGEEPAFALSDRRSEPAPPSPPVTFETLRQEALDTATRLVERLPESVDSLAVMAEVQQTFFGNSAEAVKYWQTCLERDRGCAEAYQGMATVAFKKGENEEAAALVRQALEFHPAWCEGRVLLARALMNSGQIEEAARVLEENVRESPDSAETFFLLGRAYLQLKRYDEAKQRLLAAVEIDPDSRYIYHQLATACVRLGEREEAEKYRQEFQARKTADEDWAESMDRRYPDMNVDLNIMRQNTAWIHVRAGKVYYTHGLPEQGAKEWARAAELDPVCREELAAAQRELWQGGQK